ncbi:hypothetical protein B0O80DRAFT_501068 [Mortierella sp. GBAus27b]|nr:hypothetical protein B0O80DRAFT_501068 [Mortierella sp. GBAus27b]
MSPRAPLPSLTIAAVNLDQTYVPPKADPVSQPADQQQQDPPAQDDPFGPAFIVMSPTDSMTQLDHSAFSFPFVAKPGPPSNTSDSTNSTAIQIVSTSATYTSQAVSLSSFKSWGGSTAVTTATTATTTISSSSNSRQEPAEPVVQDTQDRGRSLAVKVEFPKSWNGSRRGSSQHSRPIEVKETRNACMTQTADGQTQLGQYVLKKVLGRGAYGIVHLGQHTHEHTRYAIKEFSKSKLRKKKTRENMYKLGPGRRRGPSASTGANSSPLELIRGEVAILKKLNHDNIVKLYEVLDVTDEDSMFMVMELCEMGVLTEVSLNDKLSKIFDDEECRDVFRQMVLGIEYLHEHEIIHRDIKPDNLLRSQDGTLKIVDFGVSKIFKKEEGDLTENAAGSPAFMAPELCAFERGKISGRAADVWSMGVTLYCIRYGKIPFRSNDPMELRRVICEEEADLEAEKDPKFKALMMALLQKDPAKRITLDELRNDPWLTRDGTDELISKEENTENAVTDITSADLDGAFNPISRKMLSVLHALRFIRCTSRSPSPAPRPLTLECTKTTESTVIGTTGSDDDGSVSISGKSSAPSEPMSPILPSDHDWSKDEKTGARMPLSQVVNSISNISIRRKASTPSSPMSPILPSDHDWSMDEKIVASMPPVRVVNSISNISTSHKPSAPSSPMSPILPSDHDWSMDEKIVASMPPTRIVNSISNIIISHKPSAPSSPMSPILPSDHDWSMDEKIVASMPPVRVVNSISNISTSHKPSAPSSPMSPILPSDHDWSMDEKIVASMPPTRIVNSISNIIISHKSSAPSSPMSPILPSDHDWSMDEQTITSMPSGRVVNSISNVSVSYKSSVPSEPMSPILPSDHDWSMDEKIVASMPPTRVVNGISNVSVSYKSSVPSEPMSPILPSDHDWSMDEQTGASMPPSRLMNIFSNALLSKAGKSHVNANGPDHNTVKDEAGPSSNVPLVITPPAEESVESVESVPVITVQPVDDWKVISDGPPKLELTHGTLGMVDFGDLF